MKYISSWGGKFAGKIKHTTNLWAGKKQRQGLNGMEQIGLAGLEGFVEFSFGIGVGLEFMIGAGFLVLINLMPGSKYLGRREIAKSRNAIGWVCKVQ